MKDIRDVSGSYERIADWFDRARRKDLVYERCYLELLVGHLPKKSTVLDLGCGMGEPVAKYLLGQGIAVTGIDGSEKLLGMARVRCPGGQFLRQDMRQLDLDDSFDAIVMWHSLFHLAAEDQRRLFSRLQNFLKPNGLLLFTSGSAAGEVWSDNGGEDLYHASLDIDEYRDLLEKNQFRILAHKVDDEQAGGATVWLAAAGGPCTSLR